MEELTVDELIAKIKDQDDTVRADAWQSAGPMGAAAVKPLAALMAEMDADLARLTDDPRPDGEKKKEIGYKLAVGRAAKRALWLIVRHVGRPGAEGRRKPVVKDLCGLLGDGQPAAVRREVLWMLSEIGGEEAVRAIREIPNLLHNKEIREDARCAVQRIPGQVAIEALLDGLEAAPEDFRLALAQSLRKRGVEVDEARYPCQKLVPTKQTEVEPVGREN